MTNKEISSLVDYSAPFCISIVAPVHHLSPERQQDHLVIKKAVEAAKTLLKMKASKKDSSAQMLTAKLDEAYQQIDFLHVEKGIGIFVSADLAKVVHFPFEVHQKISVNSQFSSLELFYYLYEMRSYTLLSIQQHSAHLYQGLEDALNEVMNVDFPAIYEEEFEYAQTSKIVSHGSTVMKQFEKDTQALHEIRQKEFYRKIDHLLLNYIDEKEVFMLSAGTNEMSNFLEITKNKKLVDGKILGSFSFKDTITLGKKSWQKLQDIAQLKSVEMIQQLKEDIGRNLAVFGLQQVINAAEEAKGRTLILDREYNYLGYVTANGLPYHAGTRSKEKEHFLVNEVYERIIRLVRKNGGNVLFTDKGMLDQWEGIALQLRYP
jgi:hypothetical protein